MPLISTYDPVTMLEAINATPRPRTFLRDLLFAGREQTFTTEEVMYDLLRGRRRLAPFVSPVIGGKVMDRDGYTTHKYRPPLVQPRDVVTPERIAPRAAGESIVSAQTPADRLAGEQAAILETFDQAITRREEWMVSQLICTGVIPCVGEGVNEVVNPGFINFEALLLGDRWNVAGSTPMNDLSRWRNTIMLQTGITPNAVVMESTAASAFLSHAEVQSQLDVRRMEMGIIKPELLPNGATYLGTIARWGLDIYEYQDWYVDDLSPHATLPMLPVGAVVMVPTADRNPGAKMLYGAWTEIDEAVTYVGSRIPRVWSEKGPNAQFIEVVSRPLPTMVDVSCWFSAIVL